MRAYALDSPNWERWFALEHEEERRQGVHVDHDVPPPQPKVLPHEEEDEATYQAVLEQALQHALEASGIEEEAQWDGMEQALALSAARDSVQLRRKSASTRQATCMQTSLGHICEITWLHAGYSSMLIT